MQFSLKQTHLIIGQKYPYDSYFSSGQVEAS